MAVFLLVAVLVAMAMEDDDFHETSSAEHDEDATFSVSGGDYTVVWEAEDSCFYGLHLVRSGDRVEVTSGRGPDRGRETVSLSPGEWSVQVFTGERCGWSMLVEARE